MLLSLLGLALTLINQHRCRWIWNSVIEAHPVEHSNDVSCSGHSSQQGESSDEVTVAKPAGSADWKITFLLGFGILSTETTRVVTIVSFLHSRKWGMFLLLWDLLAQYNLHHTLQLLIILLSHFSTNNLRVCVPFVLTPSGEVCWGYPVHNHFVICLSRICFPCCSRTIKCCGTTWGKWDAVMKMPVNGRTLAQSDSWMRSILKSCTRIVWKAAS
jgi:hypothetical protein